MVPQFAAVMLFSEEKGEHMCGGEKGGGGPNKFSSIMGNSIYQCSTAQSAQSHNVIILNRNSKYASNMFGIFT